jgi:hypothetical protein
LTLAMVRNAFLWCFIMNTALLLFWAIFLKIGHGVAYKKSRRVGKISEATFDTIHYGGMLLLKVWIPAFNLVPYVALGIVDCK